MDFATPPERLMRRVGGPPESYEDMGATARRDFLALTPSSFEWDGAEVLDFGCGAGRVLRQFADEATRTR